jgi:hypothetical protein
MRHGYRRVGDSLSRIAQPHCAKSQYFVGCQIPKGFVMNVGQCAILVIALLLAVAIGLFPPWKRSINFHSEEITIVSERPIGYAFIARPPDPNSIEDKEASYEANLATSMTLDICRLGVQYIALILVTLGGMFALRGVSFHCSMKSAARIFTVVVVTSVVESFLFRNYPVDKSPHRPLW